jgi:hypothetical protein
MIKASEKWFNLDGPITRSQFRGEILEKKVKLLSSYISVDTTYSTKSSIQA